ncbi:MAG: aminomethyl-transferring glycine dehydrogenase subunit GcvPA [Planctomycetaceae bacterium]
MLPYLFNTPAEQAEMLSAIGVASIDELLEQVPERLRLQRALDLPPALTEPELEAEVRRQAGHNVSPSAATCFLGGGVYDHFIPAVVDEVVSRGEFYTAYTPYQAEASQGSLQAFFEYQTLICQLTGMDVSNASLYEGGTAVSEAAFMAMRVTNRHDKVVILGSVHPEYRQVVTTYCGTVKTEVVTVPTPGGTADTGVVENALDDKTACLVIQHPNFFGCLEETAELCEAAHRVGALAVVSFDPISLGLLKRPADYGADIAVAEGQSLGIPMQYGGPFLGILACRYEYVRKMPGRIVGQTTDRHGKTCYVLNLQTREQHIRRDKATSNICTNQGLLALRATAYLAALGPRGLREVAELSCRKAHYAAGQLSALDDFGLAFDRPFFKEFTLRCNRPADDVITTAGKEGLLIGPSLLRFGGRISNAPENALLVAVTEQRSKADIDRLAFAL